MIESIQLGGIATYREDETMAGLAKVNLVYGANGSGKTTISRLLAAGDAKRIRWVASPLEVLVYNCDFVRANFEAGDDPHVPGVFTLGEENIETGKQIEELKAKRDQSRTDKDKLSKKIEEHEASIRKQTDLLEDACWEERTKHVSRFKWALEGSNTRPSFRKRLDEARSLEKDEALPTLHELADRAEEIVGPDEAQIALLPVPAFPKLATIAADPLLGTPIVGKSGVDLAALIETLGHSDWVDHGRDFLDGAGGLCPFCQEPRKADLHARLEAYFDRAFVESIDTLGKLAKAHTGERERAVELLRELRAAPTRYLDQSALGRMTAALAAALTENESRIQGKVREPRSVVALEDTSHGLAELATIVAAANEAIRKANVIRAARPKERKRLREDFWCHLANGPLLGARGRHAKETAAARESIARLSKSRGEHEKREADFSESIRKLEATTTSVKPTVDAANSTLREYSFDGFLLEATPDNSYRLVRPDGEPVLRTLSEGERTIVTLLYFFHLAAGALTTAGTSLPRVLVIDDPISSLDSNNLYIASTLVRELIGRAAAGKDSIQQVILLTHNTHFHREIAFTTTKTRNKIDPSYWMVRKKAQLSSVHRCATDPIHSTREMLWCEVAQEDGSEASLRNAMRRILEEHFEHLGDENLPEEPKNLGLAEKRAWRTLRSWLHAGSHRIDDELHVAGVGADAGVYRDLFRRMFEALDHKRYYEMMLDRGQKLAAMTAPARAGARGGVA